jgi:hypothetical protein
MVPAELLERYAVEGYFTIDDLVESTMLARLLEAAPCVKAKVRSGEVNLYSNYAAPGEPWVIDGILTSAFGEPVFAEYMVSERLLELAHAFLGPELRLGYLGLLTNAQNVDFDLKWHRDVLNLTPADFEAAELPPLGHRQRAGSDDQRADLRFAETGSHPAQSWPDRVLRRANHPSGFDAEEPRSVLFVRHLGPLQGGRAQTEPHSRVALDAARGDSGHLS